MVSPVVAFRATRGTTASRRWSAPPSSVGTGRSSGSVWMSSARGTAVSLRARAGKPDPPQRALAVDGHIVPCQAHHAVSDELQVRIAGRVALAISARAVELEAVELDGETVLGPKRIHFVSGLLSLNCRIEAWGR